MDPARIAAALRPDTTLVSVMAVNNEVGTIQPVAEAAAAARAVGALVHTDAVQAAGWVDLAPLAAATDALSVSGHKLGGLKGAGLLYLRGRLRPNRCCTAAGRNAAAAPGRRTWPGPCPRRPR